MNNRFVAPRPGWPRHSFTNEDRCWRLTGLAWAGTDQAATRKARQELLATQRPDGGWSDLPSLQSTPYATGRSLVSLQIGGLPVSDPAYQRGIQFLLADPTERWLLVHQDPCAGLPALLRWQFPASLRSVDVGCGYQLGRDGADACLARSRTRNGLPTPVTAWRGTMEKEPGGGVGETAGRGTHGVREALGRCGGTPAAG